MYPIVALWCVPRSISTAFERMMMERDDHKIIHEPFSACYYYSSKRQSNRYSEIPDKPESEPAVVLDNIFSAAQEKPVFIKDMSSHAINFIDTETLAKFKNSFLIRTPKKALPSFFYKWPDVSLEEAGYHALGDMINMVREINDNNEAPPIIAAQDIIDKPRETIRTWCEAVDIDFIPEALNWKPRKPKRWKNWDGWHEDAAESSGFIKTGKKVYPEISDHPHLAELYAKCKPVFEEIFKKKIAIVE